MTEIKNSIGTKRPNNTPDLHVLLKKKSQYNGAKAIPKKWFASSLSNRKQFLSFNGYKLNFTYANCRVLQGFILGPLLFFIYMNDLHLVI